MRSLSGFTDWGEHETDIQLFTNIILIRSISPTGRVHLGAPDTLPLVSASGAIPPVFPVRSIVLNRHTPWSARRYLYEASALASSTPWTRVSHLPVYLSSPAVTALRRSKSVKMSKRILSNCTSMKNSMQMMFFMRPQIWQNFLTLALRKASYMDELRLSLGRRIRPESVTTHPCPLRQLASHTS